MCVTQEQFENMERLFDNLLKLMANKHCHNCKGEGQWRHKYSPTFELCSCIKKSLIPIREE